jgi:tripartite-type tricarboxylate transporter receptor subunit TctC
VPAQSLVQKKSRAQCRTVTPCLSTICRSLQNVSLYKTLPFDTLKAFTPVMLINRNPLVLVGRNTLAPDRLGDLVAYMKQQPLKAAIPGYGTTGHLATTLFAQEAGISLDQIPYRGAAPALTDLLGGQIDLFFATPQSVVQQVATGALKAYGVTSQQRLPEFPTADSLPIMFGPKLDVVYWQAMFAPAGTSDLIIRILNDALQRWSPIQESSGDGRRRCGLFSRISQGLGEAPWRNATRSMI